jgi:hypothetical protein
MSNEGSQSNKNSFRLGSGIQTDFNFLRLMSLTEVEIKAFFCVLFISLLSLFSIIQANVLYIIDDMERVLSGFTFWNRDGRPLASAASIALQLGQPLTDISPFPQILAIAIY